ncbi:hypothetical protein [Neobacillus bataviensis]|nr:hypothetical protein [Neobacillus bataviensis]
MIEEVVYQKQKFYVVAFEKAEGVPEGNFMVKDSRITVFDFDECA